MGSRLPFKFGTANIARLILSLIIAFSIWAFVTNERDPDRTQSFANLPVDGAESLSPDFQLFEALPTVFVTVKGPESVIQGISSASLSPFVDLSMIDAAGQWEVPVNVTTPEGLRDVEVEPQVISVTVGNVVSRLMEVSTIEPVNPPATLTSITLSSSQVRLVGVEQNVERVDRVEVRIVLSGRSETFSFPAQPIPRDTDNNDLSGLVRVEPRDIQVTVEFEVRAVSVPVIVRCACQDANGELEIRDLPTAIAIPSTVRVEGPSQLLSLVTEVRTLPISIENMDASGFIPNGAELDDSSLPEGVTLDRQSIAVYVEIEQQLQSFQQNVTPVNVPEHAQIELSPSTVRFDIQTADELMIQLENEPPIVIVDLDGLGAGLHVLTPRIVLPADAKVVNLSPIEIVVSIEITPPTPTPVPTATPTPTPIPTSTPIPEPTVGPSSNPLGTPTPTGGE